MDAESLKALLSSPAALFVVMLLASAANGLKNLIEAKQQGSNVGFADVFGHGLDILYTAITNSLAFALLLQTDSLNLASAIGLGYLAGSAVSLLNPQGAAKAISTTTVGPPPKE